MKTSRLCTLSVFHLPYHSIFYIISAREILGNHIQYQRVHTFLLPYILVYIHFSLHLYIEFQNLFLFLKDSAQP